MNDKMPLRIKLAVGSLSASGICAHRAYFTLPQIPNPSIFYLLSSIFSPLTLGSATDFAHALANKLDNLSSNIFSCCLLDTFKPWR